MPTGARKLTGYSDISEQVLAETSIFKNLVRQDVLVNADATSMKVYVNELMTDSDYVPGSGVTLTNDGSAYVTINNLVERGLNEILDGFTVATAPADLVMSRFTAGVATRGEYLDTTVLTDMIANGTEDVAAAGLKPTVGTIYTDILELKKNLDEAKAPKRNRVLVINPEMENLLLNVDSKIVLDTSKGDQIISEGYIGRVAGFDVYSTSLLPAGTNMIAAQLRGYAAKVTYKVDIRLEDLTNEFTGDSAIKDRIAFLYGTVRPELIRVNNGQA